MRKMEMGLCFVLLVWPPCCASSRAAQLEFDSSASPGLRETASYVADALARANPFKPKVVGSIPTAPTKPSLLFNQLQET